MFFSRPSAKPLTCARIGLKEASFKHHGIYDALVCAHHARGNAAAHLPPPILREYVAFCPVTPPVGPYEQPNEPSRVGTRFGFGLRQSVARRMNVSCALRAARMFSSFSRPAHPPAVTVPV